ncbi:hypothetical protein MIND_01244200 [Mycena indigotica]|uniref:Uncharacterized protein n=1 Tax=Mycena indigotica TaxID=2126181 RepID=A0A8H6VU96_9AGAR|nr:uncharacterized protein MIND_01244200 [Mycena indigotica]KAF7292171.1 hypothetical protein MIND_01244200 [Mycena indigotica]
MSMSSKKTRHIATRNFHLPDACASIASHYLPFQVPITYASVPTSELPNAYLPCHSVAAIQASDIPPYQRCLPARRSTGLLLIYVYLSSKPPESATTVTLPRWVLDAWFSSARATSERRRHEIDTPTPRIVVRPVTGAGDYRPMICRYHPDGGGLPGCRPDRRGRVYAMHDGWPASTADRRRVRRALTHIAPVYVPPRPPTSWPQPQRPTVPEPRTARSASSPLYPKCAISSPCWFIDLITHPQ